LRGKHRLLRWALVSATFFCLAASASDSFFESVWVKCWAAVCTILLALAIWGACQKKVEPRV
jgi:hypothetical protein